MVVRQWDRLLREFWDCYGWRCSKKLDIHLPCMAFGFNFRVALARWSLEILENYIGLCLCDTCVALQEMWLSWALLLHLKLAVRELQHVKGLVVIQHAFPYEHLLQVAWHCLEKALKRHSWDLHCSSQIRSPKRVHWTTRLCMLCK